MPKEEELRRFEAIQFSPAEVEATLKAFVDEATGSSRVLTEIVKKHGTLSKEAVKEQVKTDLGNIIDRSLGVTLASQPLADGKVMTAKQLYDVMAGYLDETYTIPHSRTRNLLDKALTNLGYDENGRRSIEARLQTGDNFNLADLGELASPLPRTPSGPGGRFPTA